MSLSEQVLCPSAVEPWITSPALHKLDVVVHEDWVFKVIVSYIEVRSQPGLPDSNLKARV